MVDDDVTMKETKARPTYAKYKSRSKEEELGLLYHMWTTGLDLEDMRVSCVVLIDPIFFVCTLQGVAKVLVENI